MVDHLTTFDHLMTHHYKSIQPTAFMMASHGDEQLALIIHLLAEKDRLVAEKDELVASKDKLWREMYRVVQERDAKIERLEGETRAKPADCAHMRSASENKVDPDNAESLQVVIDKLVVRNRALEEALRDLLDREQDDDYEGEEEDSVIRRSIAM